jgi:peptidoglycan/LPS O-acetylase OafA/YrhL
MADGADIKPLTSLRFFAALWVVLYAYWPNLAVATTPAVVQRGALGVELFFVLSGFILCHVYLPAAAAGRFSYPAFLWNRLARIYPLHLATLAALGVLAAAGLALGMKVDRNILAWSDLPANLLLVQAWGFAKVAGWNHSSWSISAEWFAYLAFPAFAWAALKLRSRPRIAVAAALALLAGLYSIFNRVAGFPLTEATIAWGALRIVPCFFLGCAIWLAWHSGAADRREAAIGASFFGAAALLGGQFGAADWIIVACFGGLILSLARLSQAGSGFGSHPALVYLGQISYAIYMVFVPWQIVFVNIAVKIFHLSDKKLPLALWLVYLAALVPLAALAHRLIENPARRAMRLWGKRPAAHEIAMTPATQ